jgi:predicted ATPase
MALSGRQCLIETHSEIIIEQLLYRIVMLSNRPPLPEQPLHKITKIYFVSNSNGFSSFKYIEADEYATLNEWPEGFFDEYTNISKRTMEEVIKKMESEEPDD